MGSAEEHHVEELKLERDSRQHLLQHSLTVADSAELCMKVRESIIKSITRSGRLLSSFATTFPIGTDETLRLQICVPLL